MCETHQHINKILNSGYLGLFSSIIDLGPSLPYHDLELFSKPQILLKELKSLVWYQMPLGHRGACNVLIEWRDTFQCKWKVMYTFHHQYFPCVVASYRLATIMPELLCLQLQPFINGLILYLYYRKSNPEPILNPELRILNPESWILS